MKRHASADELADLAAGALKPRKQGKISAHLSGCTYCTDVSNQLATVSSLLASVPVAPMPASLSSRIESAIAAESTQRLASEPATEAGRRDLPARSRRSGQGWRVPVPSGPASRLVAAAGALVIIGGGGYEIATHIAATTGTSVSSSAAGSAHVPTSQLSYGPSVTYPQGSSTESLPSIKSETKFTGPKLGEQAAVALAAAQSKGVVPSPVPKHPSQASAASPRFNQSTNGPDRGQLTGCVDVIAAGQQVLLVELAFFDNRPATIIVIASAKAGPAEVWAVGRGCSATNREVLGRADVAHI
jgi:hypothetical protein